MRNLKRVLSLGMTAAMITGLMVVGTSAAGYSDVSTEDNVEAIEVLQSVGVMVGDENGDFNPDQLVTRNEMAVVMSNLMEYNVATYSGTSPFTDVPSWAEPYVAACWTNGITAGTSATTYGGDQGVTTAQAALMLMKALGYFQYNSDFNGDWQLATTRQGNAIDLFTGVDSGVEQAMTRNDVAQLVLNTLEAGTVTASTDGSWSIGDVTIVNNVTYNYVTSNSSYAESIHSVKSTSSTSDADRYVVELGEQLYQGDLRLREGTMDDFGRPSRTWIYENSEIGTYAEDADLTYTAGVESGEIYSDLGLGKNIVADDVTVYVDGEDDASTAIRRNNDTKLPGSGNGVLTEVFYDAENNTAIITHVNTWVGTVVKSVDNDGDAYVVVAPENTAPAGIGGNEEFETTTEFADDQYVLYTYSQSSGEIESVIAAEDASGLVTLAENTDTNDTDKAALTIDGTRYTASKKVAGENLGEISVDEEYIVYLDSYGYIIYVERIDEIGDYALVLATSGGDWKNSHKALLVLTDGTTVVADTDKDYDKAGKDHIDAGTIVTYRVDEDNEYTLRPVDSDKATYKAGSQVFSMENDKAGITIDSDVINGVTTSTITANSATAFVVRDPSQGALDADEDWTAYTGIKNAPTIQAGVGDGTDPIDSKEMVSVAYYCRTGRMANVVFVLPGEDVLVKDGVQDTLYLAIDSVSNLKHDSNSNFFEYNAVLNNEITTVKVADDVTVDGAPVFGATFDVAGNYTGCTNHSTSCKSYSAHVKNSLNGLYSGYTTDKYGVITDLETYANYDEDKDRLQALQGTEGVDKVNKEYTILLDKHGDDYKYTITCDEDATFYYVDEDGKITESSYNGVVIDANDIAYAVIEDYMIQTLVIEEVKTPANVYGVEFVNTADSNAATYADYTVDGRTVSAATVLEVADKGDDLYFTIKPADGNQIVSVTGTGVADLGNGNYVVRNVKSLVTVTVDVDVIPAAKMNIQARYELSNGAKVKTDPITPMAAEPNTNYVIVAEAGDAFVEDGVVYEVVDTVAVPFVANSFANATVEVEILGAAKTAVDAAKPAGLNLTWTPGVAAADGIDYYAVGATATVAVDTGVGKWDSTATNDVTSETVEIKADGTVDGMPAAADFGYFKVDIQATGDLAGATTKDGIGVKALKTGDTVTIKFAKSGWNWSTPSNEVEVSSGAATLADKTPGDANESVTYKLTFTGTADGTIVLDDSWT